MKYTQQEQNKKKKLRKQYCIIHKRKWNLFTSEKLKYENTSNKIKQSITKPKYAANSKLSERWKANSGFSQIQYNEVLIFTNSVQ